MSDHQSDQPLQVFVDHTKYEERENVESDLEILPVQTITYRTDPHEKQAPMSHFSDLKPSSSLKGSEGPVYQKLEEHESLSDEEKMSSHVLTDEASAENPQKIEEEGLCRYIANRPYTVIIYLAFLFFYCGGINYVLYYVFCKSDEGHDSIRFSEVVWPSILGPISILFSNAEYKFRTENELLHTKFIVLELVKKKAPQLLSLSSESLNSPPNSTPSFSSSSFSSSSSSSSSDRLSEKPVYSLSATSKFVIGIAYIFVCYPIVPSIFRYFVYDQPFMGSSWASILIVLSDIILGGIYFFLMANCIWSLKQLIGFYQPNIQTKSKGKYS